MPRGGRRPGAGRPRSAEPTREQPEVHLHLNHDVMQFVEAEISRTGDSRAAVVRRLISLGMAQEKAK